MALASTNDAGIIIRAGDDTISIRGNTVRGQPRYWYEVWCFESGNMLGDYEHLIDALAVAMKGDGVAVTIEALNGDSCLLLSESDLRRIRVISASESAESADIPGEEG